MQKTLKKVWYSRATIEHYSDNEFCQTTDTADFKHECVKMFQGNFS